MKIIISHIEASSHVDGPGERTVLFVQGCALACPGCQNRALWNPADGHITDTEPLAVTLAMLAGRHGNVTISGGEPFAQPKALAYLVRSLKQAGVKNILVYSGYTWERLLHPVNPAALWVYEALSHIDTLVDGPFIAAQDDPLITWRGSRNQRPIDVRPSLASWTLNGSLVLHDWTQPEIVLTADGDALMPVGLAPRFSELGSEEKTRRCGETYGRK